MLYAESKKSAQKLIKLSVLHTLVPQIKPQARIVSFLSLLHLTLTLFFFKSFSEESQRWPMRRVQSFCYQRYFQRPKNWNIPQTFPHHTRHDVTTLYRYETFSHEVGIGIPHRRPSLEIAQLQFNCSHCQRCWPASRQQNRWKRLRNTVIRYRLQRVRIRST